MTLLVPALGLWPEKHIPNSVSLPGAMAPEEREGLTRGTNAP